MLNERITELRKQLDLKQNAFASQLGITAAAMSRIESGERGTSNQLIKSICKEWDVSEEWLREGTGEMFVVLTRREQAASAVGKLIKENNPFITNALIALGELSTEDWKKIEEFVDSIKKD